jgi:hypothetical protein
MGWELWLLFIVDACMLLSAWWLAYVLTKVEDIEGKDYA